VPPVLPRFGALLLFIFLLSPGAAQTPDSPPEPGAGELSGGEAGAGERFSPLLYLGLRGGASLDSQFVRPSGPYKWGTSPSFGGEAALTVEWRLLRRLSIQAEGIAALNAFGAFRMQSAEGPPYTIDRYHGLFLLFPLLAKIPLELNGFTLSPLAGPYYILSLKRTMGGESYGDERVLPLGVIAGVDLGHPLGPGEFYGSLRYGIDLGVNIIGDTGLQYTPGRLVFSLGYKFLLTGRK
jgi:hypothetical protein